jgi:outer membrane receptor for ferrienterochelin and colicins
MKQLFLILMAIIIMPAQSVLASNPVTSINGQIIHTKTRLIIPFLNISLKGTTVGTMTDANGRYNLKGIPQGSHTLIITGVGFKRVEKPVLITQGKSLELNLETEEESIAMNEVVISASRNERNRQEAPVIVSIINPKVFETTNSTNLSQGLNFQAGLRVENSCQNCGFPQVRINGLDGQYSQILIDSRPIFSSLSGVYGLEQLPTNMIERVEVIRGGGSALFGSNAVGGTINIITKEPLRNSMSIGNNTTLIGFKTPDVNTTLNASLVSDDYKAGVYLFGMVRDRNHYDHDGDGFSELGMQNASTIGFRSYYKTGSFSKISLEYHNLNEYRRGGNNFDRPPHEADIAEQTQYYTNGGGIKYDIFSSDYRHRFNIFASMQHNNRSSYYGAGKDPNAYGVTTDLTVVTGVQYTVSFAKLLFLPSELTSGVEYNINHLEDKAPGYNRYLDQKVRISSLFVQNEWSNTQFGILLGARLDKHNLISDPIISPRVNIRYNPSKLVNFRATYSSGFRAPQAYDEDLHILAVSGEVAIIGIDPNLKAERSHSYSASVDLYPNLGSIKTNFLLEGFYTQLKDKFELVEAGTNAQGNLLRMRMNGPGAFVTGVNMEVKAFFSHEFDIQGGFTHQKSQYEQPLNWANDPSLAPQKKMFRTPDNYGFLTANYEITEELTTSLSGTYTGSMLVPHVISTVDPNNASLAVANFTEKTTRQFVDMGFKVSYTIPLSKDMNIQLTAGIQNIFDSYQTDLDKGGLRDAKYIYGPALPRSLNFGVKISL